MSWPGLLTPEKAAEYLGLCKRSIDRLRQAGYLKPVSFKMPGASKPVVRYRLSDLEEFVSGLKYGEGEF